MGKSMETLTDTQKSIAEFLITWARDHKAGETSELLVDEPELAKALGAPSWKRSYLHDLDMLSSYCARKNYPLVSLMVVIPGLEMPEKDVMIHAFKATLSNAENKKHLSAELSTIKKTKQSTWDAFMEDVHPSEE
jgi:hypothetical protein